MNRTTFQSTVTSNVSPHPQRPQAAKRKICTRFLTPLCCVRNDGCILLIEGQKKRRLKTLPFFPVLTAAASSALSLSGTAYRHSERSEESLKYPQNPTNLK
jgi:hypothetical protein